MNASGQTGWELALASGKTHEALKIYLESAAPRTELVGLLKTVNDVRRLLSYKKYDSASRALGSIIGTAYRLFDIGQTIQQLELLAEMSQNTMNRDAETRLADLEGFTSPILQAEVETLRGTLLIEIGRKDDAYSAFERANTLDPRHHRAWTNRGNIRFESGNAEAAIAMYRTAIDVAPEYAVARLNLGAAYRSIGQIGNSVHEIRIGKKLERRSLSRSSRTRPGEPFSPEKRRARPVLRAMFYLIFAFLALFWLRSQGIV